jgi:hypothetical protein
LLKLTLSFAVQNIIEKPRDGFKIIQSNLWSSNLKKKTTIRWQKRDWDKPK